MLKKLIAGALSASLLVSAAVSGNLNSLVTEKNTPSDRTIQKSEVSVEGSNSLGKYIGDIASDRVNDSIRPLSNNSSDLIFAIGNVEFDNKTGKIKIVSDQSIDCNILISFIDDDSDDKIDLKLPVKKGRSVVSETETDINALPEYYIIRVILTDKSGKELSSEFTIYKYDRAMQELINSDIHDYNEEYVVNLDESEETNFIVLSEDTVMAESSEQENTLVSADYDNEVYTFDNIDDSIRNLENGDYFYVRPSENDIIMLNVKEVNVNGDEATIVGGGEVDDMLAAMKVETTADLSGATADITTADPDVYFPDYDEETGVIDMSDNKLRFEYRPDIKKPYDKTYEGTYSLTYGRNKEETEEDNGQNGLKQKLFDALNETLGKGSELIGDDINDGSISFQGEVTLESRVYIYKQRNNIDVSLQEKLTLEFAAEIGISQDISLNFQETGCKLSLALCDIKMPTQIPGVLIDIIPSVDITFETNLRISKTLETVKGFWYTQKEDGDKINRLFLPIHDPVGISSPNSSYGISNLFPDISLEGAFSVALSLNIKATFFHPKLFSAGITVSAGVEVNLSSGSFVKLIGNMKDRDNELEPVMPDLKMEDHKQHMCNNCFKGNLILFLEFDGSFTVFKEEFKFDDLVTHDIQHRWEYPLNSFYLSTDYGPGWGECPHYRYQTTLYFKNEDNGDPITGINVSLNGVEEEVNNGKVVFYCKKGTYELTINDKIKQNVTVGDGPCVESFSIAVNIDKNGENKLNIKGVSTSPVATTTKATTETVTTQVMEPLDIDTDKFPLTNYRTDSEKNTKTESVLDDENYPKNGIYANLYSNGRMHIIGNGEMFNYNSDNCPSSNKIVKENTKIVEFDDIDPEGGHIITSVGSYSFANCENLETVVLPANIEKIGDGAFNGCTKLRSITYEGSPNAGKKAIDLPPSLKSIGYSAFSGCSSLGGKLDLTGNSALEEIGTEAFFGSGITSLILPSTVKNVGQQAFGGCLTLSKATIYGSDEMSISTIFDNNTGLEEMTVYNLTDILNNFKCGDLCAYGDGSHHFHLFFYSLNYPDTLETIIVKNDEAIGTGAFRNMKQLKNIILPEKLKSIGNSSFSECNSLEKIEIPETVEEIGNYAFSNCSSLKTITIPDGIKSIPDGCFNGCTSLESIDLPESIDSIGSFAFSGTKEDRACYSLKSITIPSNVTVLPDSCFANCTGLEKVILSENIIQIPVNCFKNCKSLKSIVFPEGVQKIVSPGHVAEIVLGCDNLTEIYIPKTISFIAENSFGVTINDDFGTVYYGGTEEEWEALKATQMKNYSTSKLNGNDSIFNANVIFNAKPEDMSSYVALQEEFVPSGDVNGNGKLDLGDALAILQYIANSSKYPLSEEAIKQADVYNTGDGITPMDALAIQQYDAGLIDSLPVYR
ncbi:MAG TPA: leucine-rich repeat protein [Ruminococcus sp.]|nr:leucine-rich repeat protein [Ruminococcus sp.]